MATEHRTMKATTATISRNQPTRSSPPLDQPGGRLQSTVNDPLKRTLITGPRSRGSYTRRGAHKLSFEVRRVERKTIVVMEGDQTGQELLEEALRVLDPAVTGLELDFIRYDLSLENRRATENRVVHEAAEAMKEHGFGIKAATVTPETSGDVGSPNALLRTGIDGTVIVRTGRRIPGVNPVTGVHSPVSD